MSFHPRLSALLVVLACLAALAAASGGDYRPGFDGYEHDYYGHPEFQYPPMWPQYGYPDYDDGCHPELDSCELCTNAHKWWCTDRPDEQPDHCVAHPSFCDGLAHDLCIDCCDLCLELGHRWCVDDVYQPSHCVRWPQPPCEDPEFDGDFDGFTHPPGGPFAIPPKGHHYGNPFGPDFTLPAYHWTEQALCHGVLVDDCDQSTCETCVEDEGLIWCTNMAPIEETQPEDACMLPEACADAQGIPLEIGYCEGYNCGECLAAGFAYCADAGEDSTLEFCMAPWEAPADCEDLSGTIIPAGSGPCDCESHRDCDACRAGGDRWCVLAGFVPGPSIPQLCVPSDVDCPFGLTTWPENQPCIPVEVPSTCIECLAVPGYGWCLTPDGQDFCDPGAGLCIAPAHLLTETCTPDLTTCETCIGEGLGWCDQRIGDAAGYCVLPAGDQCEDGIVFDLVCPTGLGSDCVSCTNGSDIWCQDQPLPNGGSLSFCAPAAEAATSCDLGTQIASACNCFADLTCQQCRDEGHKWCEMPGGSDPGEPRVCVDVSLPCPDSLVELPLGMSCNDCTATTCPECIGQAAGSDCFNHVWCIYEEGGVAGECIPATTPPEEITILCGGGIATTICPVSLPGCELIDNCGDCTTNGCAWCGSSCECIPIEQSGLCYDAELTLFVLPAECPVEFADLSVAAINNLKSQFCTSALTQTAILDILYAQTGGADWNRQSGWTNPDICAREGVACTASGRVTWLNLRNNNLTGTIPAELGCLPQLKALVLNDNHLSGLIPPELAFLADSLMYLSLHNNLLSGGVPPELGELDALKYLYVDRNNLGCCLPAELGQLRHLIELHVACNNMPQDCPLEAMPALETLPKLNGLRLQCAGPEEWPAAWFPGKIVSRGNTHCCCDYLNPEATHVEDCCQFATSCLSVPQPMDAAACTANSGTFLQESTCLSTGFCAPDASA
jgi:hypothetical protein